MRMVRSRSAGSRLMMFLTGAVMLMVRPLATAMDNLTLSGVCNCCLQWRREEHLRFLVSISICNR